MSTINSAGGNTTITLSYTAPSAKMLNFINDALLYLFPDGYDFDADGVNTLVADMTNNQKAGLIEAKVKEHIKNLALSHYVNDAGDSARTTAITGTTTRYE